jgi:hypothetical protein
MVAADPPHGTVDPQRAPMETCPVPGRRPVADETAPVPGPKASGTTECPVLVAIPRPITRMRCCHVLGLAHGLVDRAPRDTDGYVLVTNNATDFRALLGRSYPILTTDAVMALRHGCVPR